MITTIRCGVALAWALLALPAAAQHEYSEEGALACLKCHESERVMGILETPHADQSDPRTPAARQQCESCHGPSATHMNFPMHVGNIRFTAHDATTPVARRNEACLECHHEGARANWKLAPHGFENACVDCHVAHKVRDPILSEADQNRMCTEACHQEILKTAPDPTDHPLTGDERMPCTSCHNPHGPLDLEGCGDCHVWEVVDLAKQSPKAQDYHQRAIDRNIGCTACHKGFVHAMPEIEVSGVVD